MTRRRSRLATYLDESRDIGRSLALVIPLLLAYEVAVTILEPPVRNSAERAVGDLLGHLAPQTLTAVRRISIVALVGATLFWLGRDRARVARPQFVLGEAFLHAVALGPLVGFMLGGVGLSAETVVLDESPPQWLPFLLSVGAGLWEEIVFRLILLGGLAVLLVRGLALRPRAAIGVAIVVSALAFATYHHVGASGEPFALDRFAFRSFAGTILGLLFALRGFAVVVYMHVFYDVLCDVRMLLT